MATTNRAQQLALPGIEEPIKGKTAAVYGFEGEKSAKRWFEAHGYKAKLLPLGERGDLRVTSHETGEVAHIEVKTARRSEKYGFWQFSLIATYKDYRKADFLLLQAVMDDSGGIVRLLIPVSAIPYQKQLVMRNPKSAKSKYSVFIVNDTPCLTGGSH